MVERRSMTAALSLTNKQRSFVRVQLHPRFYARLATARPIIVRIRILIVAHEHALKRDRVYVRPEPGFGISITRRQVRLELSHADLKPQPTTSRPIGTCRFLIDVVSDYQAKCVNYGLAKTVVQFGEAE